MSVLLIAEHNHVTLHPATLNTVSCARALNSDIDILVVGENTTPVAETAADIPGIRKILHVDEAAFSHHLAETIAPLVALLATDYTHILAPSSTFGKNILPRVAGMLDVMQISDVMEVIDSETFKRPIYAGNALATVRAKDPLKIMTVRTSTFQAAPAKGGNTPIEAVSQTVLDKAQPGALCTYIGQELSQSERPELTSARIVISGGRGLQKGENFQLLERIADKLGAAVGASRAAVDSGFVPNDFQVGQTGKIVAPDLYIAVGISGAIQHLAGIKDAKVIVGINKDEEAPIFQIADYGLCADLFEALPELESKL